MWVEAIEHEGLPVSLHCAPRRPRRSAFTTQDNGSGRPVKACPPAQAVISGRRQTSRVGKGGPPNHPSMHHAGSAVPPRPSFAKRRDRGHGVATAERSPCPGGHVSAAFPYPTTISLA